MPMELALCVTVPCSATAQDDVGHTGAAAGEVHHFTWVPASSNTKLLNIFDSSPHGQSTGGPLETY
eukprot:1157718-Pelagomonas_calceolata.AAC.14